MDTAPTFTTACAVVNHAEPSNEYSNNGAGTPLNKQGLAASWRTGIGERDEFLLSAYVLRNRNGMNYGLPWIRPSATSPMQHTTVLPLDPSTSYAPFRVYNIGNNQPVELMTFIRTIEDAIGQEAKKKKRERHISNLSISEVGTPREEIQDQI